MKDSELFDFLEAARKKPPAFSKYTARDLWTHEHTSARMLAYHLNEEVDLSSRRGSFVDRSAAWMVETFNLAANRRVADFGCGPGLYSSRLAEAGAAVTGIDFSARSIAYAKEFARNQSLEIEYIEADYLTHQPTGKFDLIIMIMCDYCALSPTQRSSLLASFKRLLAKDGRILLDVYSQAKFEKVQERFVCERENLNGFWAEAPYYTFVSSFKYDVEKVSLEKYTIVEQDRQREVYNWLQYFTPETLKSEAKTAGLNVEACLGDVAGGAYEADSNEFAVVLTADAL